MSWSLPAYESILCLVGQRTGLNFTPPRRESAECGIRRSMARMGFTDPEYYRERVATDDTVLDDLIVELTIGETYFFREPEQFEFMRRAVLPEIRARRGREHVLRVWSAGCASGEEVYSLAMLFEQEGMSDRAHFLATDIARPALAKARRATYGAWSLRGEGARAAIPFLHRRGSHYVVDEEIRRRITFEHLNLAQDVYPSTATGTWGMDLILCRNVLIYLDRETVRSVARRLFESLAPGGWLITASSDPLLAGDAPYESVVTSAGVFYRRKGVDGPPSPGGSKVPESIEGSSPGIEPTTPRCSISVRGARGGTTVEASTPEDHLAEARKAFARGDYAHAWELARIVEASPDTAALAVRSLANLDLVAAERTCANAAARYPLSTELHYLHAVLLMGVGRYEDAARAAQRVIYLDRSLAIAHFTLGSILSRCGNLRGARRAYRNAQDLCAACPADETVALSDGEPARRLAEAAALRLTALDALSPCVNPPYQPDAPAKESPNPSLARQAGPAGACTVI